MSVAPTWGSDMNTHAGQKRIVLGAEYDKKLVEELLATLRECGARAIDQWAGVGGSQEVQRLDVVVGDEVIAVEAETYIGLTISGDANLVDRVAARLRARMSASRA